MSREEFIQQFVINAAGPLLTLVNYRGEQRYSESKIIGLAESFADECCKDLRRNYILIDELSRDIRSCNEAIKDALNEHQTTNNWPFITKALESALDDIKKIADRLSIEIE